MNDAKSPSRIGEYFRAGLACAAATLLTLPPEAAGVAEQLSEIHHQIADLLRELPTPAAPDVAQLGLIPA
ncbi:MAG: hypothetical protein FIA96_02160, partial [Betaproteobacteria bacterium]|nr:hypothetical protein [Betaproteobacteria bacterium]